ncbi:MAG: N-acetyl-glucosamine-6-phosphate deacetylase [Trichoglossum hirsutum]|nr:MAG: N-acetyl-glucosamine-6-phosphate deacetylase [Trichoglossum hirsutum]
MRTYAALFLFASLASALWPIPVDYTHGNTTLWISRDVQVTYSGSVCRPMSPSNRYPFLYEQDFDSFQNSTNSTIGGGYSPSCYSSIVNNAIKRTLDTICEEGFVPWKLHPRNSDFEPSPAGPKNQVSSIVVKQTSPDPVCNSRPLADKVDESYELDITGAGQITLAAPSYRGLLHGLNTLTQLFYQHSQKGAGVYTNLAPVAIKDKPKFPWRGLNMDVARNWYPVADILRTIDALSWNKFNHLHVHITDAQSWPLQIPALPELAEKGAYAKGLSYSPSDIRQIQEYGIDRGVEVVIEIDMPGHQSIVGVSHPELITAFNIQPNWDTYAAEPPSGQLKLNSPAVTSFLHTLFDDLLPRLSPYSAYFHTGGDEVNVNAYALDEGVNSNDSNVIQPFLQKFIDQNHDQLRAKGLTPIVWEEMLLQWNLTLGKDVVVQTWQSDEAVKGSVKKGYQTLVGNYNFWYLDCGKGQWLNFQNGDSFQKFYPFADYCSPTKNWRLVYSYDPTAGLTPDEAKLVLGGEVHIWSEQTDPVNLDDMVWPRASAAGEVLWSGRQDASGQNRSQIDASPRLAEVRERMVLRGIKCGPSQMAFCTQNDPTWCAL